MKANCRSAPAPILSWSSCPHTSRSSSSQREPKSTQTGPWSSWKTWVASPTGCIGSMLCRSKDIMSRICRESVVNWQRPLLLTTLPRISLYSRRMASLSRHGYPTRRTPRSSSWLLCCSRSSSRRRKMCASCWSSTNSKTPSSCSRSHTAPKINWTLSPIRWP